jgi:3-oxoacid CoA-transferase
VAEFGKPREIRIFDGKPYLMETALRGDVAILRAWKVDTAGNCVFRYTTKSFAPLMAKAAKLAIVEAENIVEVGSIDPNDVNLPGIYIDRIVPATEPSQVEILKTRPEDNGKDAKEAKSDAQTRRNRIARRSAKELKDGFYVNLGVGKHMR